MLSFLSFSYIWVAKFKEDEKTALRNVLNPTRNVYERNAQEIPRNFPAFDENLIFITVLRRGHQWSLS
jgi:hypothetical protein